VSSRRQTAFPALALVMLAALWLGACGGGGDSADQADIPGGADPAATQVIDDWSNALRAGDIEAAADFFKVPSVARNGTPPLDLDTRQKVVVFNQALPCGAKLVRAIDHAGFTIATFELTERPGPGQCGAGVGGTAQTAFKIEDGKITEWDRVGGGESPTAPPVEGPVV
jgi:hypothetical protein